MLSERASNGYIFSITISHGNSYKRHASMKIYPVQRMGRNRTEIANVHGSILMAAVLDETFT